MHRRKPTQISWKRKLTAPLRPLPQFLILGAQRAGTTSLYRYLTQHPAIGAALRKEVHYFDLEFRRPPAWYRAQFPTVWQLARGARRARCRSLSGEATPYYLFHPCVPKRVAALLPQARFIVLLRNPVDRAYSHYQLTIRNGHETESFAAAVAAEPGRLADEAARLVRGEADYSYPHHKFAYLARGRYEEQLRRWFAVLPRDRFLILGSKEFFADPQRAVADCFRHLGLPPAPIDTRCRHNQRTYEPMPDAMRAELTEYFRPHNEALFQLLGRRFDWDVKRSDAALPARAA